jgi:hypothetical protein
VYLLCGVRFISNLSDVANVTFLTFVRFAELGLVLLHFPDPTYIIPQSYT